MDSKTKIESNTQERPKRERTSIKIYDGHMLRGDLATFVLSNKKMELFEEPSANVLKSTVEDSEEHTAQEDVNISDFDELLQEAFGKLHQTTDLPNPTAYTKVHFLPIKEVDASDPDVLSKVYAERINGVPIIVNGFKDWTSFAEGWVKQDKKKGPTVDVAALHKLLGEEKVPIVKKNYNQKKPIHHSEKFQRFLKNSWNQNDPKFYLHQWQFPLSNSACKAMKIRNKPIPFLGEDLLEYWYTGTDESRTGVNPYQYFFMGAAGTTTKLHRDLGGMAIMIAPLVGEKEVLLVHRDDSPKLYNESASVTSSSLYRFPLLVFARAWRTVIKPGQILILPQGTFHAAKNLTKCLSYSRFHLDEVNLPAFADSYLAKDAPEVNHLHILWSAVSGVINFFRKPDNLASAFHHERKVSSMIALLHIIRATLWKPEQSEDIYSWRKMVKEIEVIIATGSLNQAMPQPQLIDKLQDCSDSHKVVHEQVKQTSQPISKDSASQSSKEQSRPIHPSGQSESEAPIVPVIKPLSLWKRRSPRLTPSEDTSSKIRSGKKFKPSLLQEDKTLKPTSKDIGKRKYLKSTHKEPKTICEPAFPSDVNALSELKLDTSQTLSDGKMGMAHCLKRDMKKCGTHRNTKGHDTSDCGTKTMELLPIVGECLEPSHEVEDKKAPQQQGPSNKKRKRKQTPCGQSCVRGDMIIVKYFSKRLKANVLKVLRSGNGIVVHYEGFPSYYNELKLIDEVMNMNGKPAKFTDLKINDMVQVLWGCNEKVFHATVLSKYTGRMIYVYYPRFESDWNQWLKPEDIV